MAFTTSWLFSKLFSKRSSGYPKGVRGTFGYSGKKKQFYPVMFPLLEDGIVMLRSQSTQAFKPKQRRIVMKTSEDVLVLGLYSNDCCEEELIFDEGDTFWRCPRCCSLCRWELTERITKDVDVLQVA